MLTTFVTHLLGILFVKGLFKSFAPPPPFFKNWDDCLMYLFVRITLYILVTSLRLNICIANIFSDSVICLLTLLMSFDEWTFFILMQSHVSVFSLSPGLSCNKEQLISFPSLPQIHHSGKQESPFSNFLVIYVTIFFPKGGTKQRHYVEVTRSIIFLQ